MDTQKINSWADRKLLEIKTMTVIALAKMGYNEEDAWEAVDIFMYLDYKLLWNRIKERRLKRWQAKRTVL